MATFTALRRWGRARKSEAEKSFEKALAGEGGIGKFTARSESGLNGGATEGESVGIKWLRG
jgi:hypothetical protein